MEESKDHDSPNSPLDSFVSEQIQDGALPISAAIASPDGVLPPPAETLDEWKPIEHLHSTFSDASSSSSESDAFMDSDDDDNDGDDSVQLSLHSPVSQLNNLPSSYYNPFYHSYNREYYPSTCTRGPCFLSRPEITPTGVGAGLSNLGNTCFINAILQCITHTVPLVEELRFLNHLRLSENCVEGFCVFCVISEHVELALSSSGDVISPNKLVDNIHYISSNFERDQQEDAHEFLQCLLEKLERSLEAKTIDQAFSYFPANLVNKVFGGQLLSKLQCCSCGYRSNIYEPLIDLSLEIEDVDTLLSALESFTKMEKMTKLKCLNCKEDVSMEKQLIVEQAPSIATFHLKRFKSNPSSYVEKIDKHVEFPLVLDLQQYTSGSHDNDVTLKYNLYAVVVHSGYFSTSGHYFCFIRSAPDIWYCLNDSEVNRVSEDIVLSQEAYILLYAKQDTPWFSSLMGGNNLCFDLETSLKSVVVVDNADIILRPSAADMDSHVSNKYIYAAEEVSVEFSSETTHHGVQANVTRDPSKVTSMQFTCGSRTDTVMAVDECKSGSSVAETSTPLEACSHYDEISCNTMDICSTSSPGENNSNTSGEATDRIFCTLTQPISRNTDNSVEPEGENQISSDDTELANQNTYRRTLDKAMEREDTREAHRLVKKNIPGLKRTDRLLAAMRGYSGNSKKRRLRLYQKNKAHSHRLYHRTRHLSVRHAIAHFHRNRSR